MSKLALRAQTVDIANLSLRQDLLAKNVLMTAQRNFGLGNGPNRHDCDIQALFFLYARLPACRQAGARVRGTLGSDCPCAITFSKR